MTDTQKKASLVARTAEQRIVTHAAVDAIVSVATQQGVIRTLSKQRVRARFQVTENTMTRLK